MRFTRCFRTLTRDSEAFGEDRRDLGEPLTSQRRRFIDGTSHLLGEDTRLERTPSGEQLRVVDAPAARERRRSSPIGVPGLVHGIHARRLSSKVTGAGRAVAVLRGGGARRRGCRALDSHA